MLTRRRVGQLPEDNETTIRPAASSNKWSDDDKKGATSPVTNGSSLRPAFTSSVPQSSFQQRVTQCSSQDRTQEFTSVIKSMQMRQNFGITTPFGRNTTSKNDFTLIASKIGKDLASTFAKLEKLTLLAIKRSNHPMDSQEVEQLTNIVRQDLSMLNKQIAQLQQILKSGRSSSSRQDQMHANTVVVALQSKLVGISTEFKAVLQQRNNDIKEESLQANRLSSAKHSSYNDSEHDGATDYATSQVVINMDDGRQLHQRQQQVLRQEATQRSDTMNSVEQTIVELGGIFQQFAHMVKEQEELIQRIDAHVDETHLNVDVAHSEIVKYFHSVSSNRSLMIKIFIVLMTFFTLFVYFMR